MACKIMMPSTGKNLKHKKMVEKTQQLYTSLLKPEQPDKNQNDK